MKKMWLLGAVALSLVLGGGILACDSDEETTETDVTIKLVETEVTLVYGAEGQGTKQLVAVVTPSDTPVTWVSNNEKVAVVSNQGTVAAGDIGSASVTVYAGKAFDTATIIVKKQVPATSVTFTPDTLTLSVGEKKTVKAELDAETTDIITKWESADTEIVTVDNNGNLVGIAEGGPVSIFVTTNSGKKLEGLEVTVEDSEG